MKVTNQQGAENELGGERRRSTRYQIRGAAWFQWETDAGHLREGMGVTRDIGKAGAFIETPEKPPVGARLKAVVTIASDEKDPMRARLCGAGDVRHVQPGGEAGGGFGAWVVFHTE